MKYRLEKELMFEELNEMYQFYISRSAENISSSDFDLDKTNRKSQSLSSPLLVFLLLDDVDLHHFDKTSKNVTNSVDPVIKFRANAVRTVANMVQHLMFVDENASQKKVWTHKCRSRDAENVRAWMVQPISTTTLQSGNHKLGYFAGINWLLRVMCAEKSKIDF